MKISLIYNTEQKTLFAISLSPHANKMSIIRFRDISGLWKWYFLDELHNVLQSVITDAKL